MASTYWPISFLQTTVLGIRLKLWVLSCIWRAGPCSQQLGHVKVTLPVPGSLVVFQSEWGEGLCELASPSLCRLYLYSAWLFSPLMTAAISPGAFWACFSKLYFLFWFSLACWGFAETKANENKMHKLTEVQGVAESRSRKADVQDEGFGLRHFSLFCSQADVLAVSGSLVSLKPWLLPNYQANDFFLCLLRSFTIHPCSLPTPSFNEHFLRGSSGPEPWVWVYALPSPHWPVLGRHSTFPGLSFTNLKCKF